MRAALALLLTLAATPAAAASEEATSKPHNMTVVPPEAGGVRPKPQASSPAKPLTTLHWTRHVGEAAPICRTQCAEQRYACLSGEDDGNQCDTRWSRCVAVCGGDARAGALNRAY